MAPRTLKGIGGWLVVFLVLSAAASAMLVLSLALLIRAHDGAWSLDETAIGIIGISLAVIANFFAIVWLGREKPRGVPLAQRGLILTFLATLHLAVLLHLASVEFLELILFATGMMLLWILYFGLSLRAKHEHIQVDLSRRIEATFPSEKRGLPWAVRTSSTLLIWVYALYVATLAWRVFTVVFS